MRRHQRSFRRPHVTESSTPAGGQLWNRETHSISLSSGNRAAISSAEIVPAGWTCLAASFSFFSSRAVLAGAAAGTIISLTVEGGSEYQLGKQSVSCGGEGRGPHSSTSQRYSTTSYHQVYLSTTIFSTMDLAVVCEIARPTSLCMKPSRKGHQRRFPRSIHRQEILSLMRRRFHILGTLCSFLT